jgi:hypothetical protein
MDQIVNVLTGLLIRIGLPLGISILVFMLLRRLDGRWQKHAIQLPVIAAGSKKCWEVKKCSEEKRKTCPAASQPNVPCWHVFRSKDGVLREPCLDCDMFRATWVPVKS